MRRSLLAGFAISFMLAAPVTRACWTCGSDYCCHETAQNSSGRTSCSHNVQCLASCFCYYCSTTGGTCAGTGPAQCDNPMGICEENQGFLLVPNGEPLDPQMLVAPPVSKQNWSAGQGCAAT